ncbi:MAG: hypothetical protein BGO37_10710 [Cellulomonas sp. 73-92]|nr:MAG: hypothetical protein BGO37_10710 [Cellulomonas sp. 73-92]
MSEPTAQPVQPILTAAAASGSLGAAGVVGAALVGIWVGPLLARCGELAAELVGSAAAPLEGAEAGVWLPEHPASAAARTTARVRVRVRTTAMMLRSRCVRGRFCGWFMLPS